MLACREMLESLSKSPPEPASLMKKHSGRRLLPEREHVTVGATQHSKVFYTAAP